MFHKIISVTPLQDFTLLLHFSDGVAKEYDVSQLFDRIPELRVLQTPGLFKTVQVDTGGYGISWNDDLDLSSDELFENGRIVTTPFDGFLSFADASTLWALNESTLRKAVSYGKLKSGIDCMKYGKQWLITKEAMKREYGEIKKAVE